MSVLLCSSLCVSVWLTAKSPWELIFFFFTYIYIYIDFNNDYARLTFKILLKHLTSLGEKICQL